MFNMFLIVIGIVLILMAIPYYVYLISKCFFTGKQEAMREVITQVVSDTFNKGGKNNG